MRFLRDNRDRNEWLRCMNAASAYLSGLPEDNIETGSLADDARMIAKLADALNREFRSRCGDDQKKAQADVQQNDG